MCNLCADVLLQHQRLQVLVRLGVPGTISSNAVSLPWLIRSHETGCQVQSMTSCAGRVSPAGIRPDFLTCLGRSLAAAHSIREINHELGLNIHYA